MKETTHTLYRSKQNRWLAGVCGGMAEHFGTNAILFRIIFAIFLKYYGSFTS